MSLISTSGLEFTEYNTKIYSEGEQFSLAGTSETYFKIKSKNLGAATITVTMTQRKTGIVKSKTLDAVSYTHLTLPTTPYV